jgi:hypothetical protein
VRLLNNMTDFKGIWNRLNRAERRKILECAGTKYNWTVLDQIAEYTWISLSPEQKDLARKGINACYR